LEERQLLMTCLEIPAALKAKALQKQHLPGGFTVMEAVVASAILTLGLSAAMQLSAEIFSASEASRHLEIASGLAQDLAECWQIQTPPCLAQFSNSGPLTASSSDESQTFIRTWSVSSLALALPDIASSPPIVLPTDEALLQELKIEVSWTSSVTGRQSQLGNWQVRRASTPVWAGP
jgi:Tfp pilus assembly protein PilV